VLGIEAKAAGKLIGNVGFSPWDGAAEVDFAVEKSCRSARLSSP